MYLVILSPLQYSWNWSIQPLWYFITLCLMPAVSTYGVIIVVNSLCHCVTWIYSVTYYIICQTCMTVDSSQVLQLALSTQPDYLVSMSMCVSVQTKTEDFLQEQFLYWCSHWNRHTMHSTNSALILQRCNHLWQPLPSQKVNVFTHKKTNDNKKERKRSSYFSTKLIIILRL